MTKYFGIGVFHSLRETNIGTLWRSAYQLGASFIFTVGRRYQKQCSDTCSTINQIPCYHYLTLEDFLRNIPIGCELIGIETNGTNIEKFYHPQKCIYLLGAEDSGLSKEAMQKCQKIITLPSVRIPSYNVSVAGALVMFHRHLQGVK
jgi:tRNA G18 (ribose-2'-O)-methylase SpoU